MFYHPRHVIHCKYFWYVILVKGMLKEYTAFNGFKMLERVKPEIKEDKSAKKAANINKNRSEVLPGI